MQFQHLPFLDTPVQDQAEKNLKVPALLSFLLEMGRDHFPPQVKIKSTLE